MGSLLATEANDLGGLYACCFFAFFCFVIIPALFVLAYRWEKALLIKGDAVASSNAPKSWQRLALSAKIDDLSFGGKLLELATVSAAHSLWTTERHGVVGWAFRCQTGPVHRTTKTCANGLVLKLPDWWLEDFYLAGKREVIYESKQERPVDREIRRVVEEDGRFELQEHAHDYLLLLHNGPQRLEELPTVMRDAEELMKALKKVLGLRG